MKRPAVAMPAVSEALEQTREQALSEFIAISAGIGRIKRIIDGIEPNTEEAANLLTWIAARLLGIRAALGGPLP